MQKKTNQLLENRVRKIYKQILSEESLWQSDVDVALVLNKVKDLLEKDVMPKLSKIEGKRAEYYINLVMKNLELAIDEVDIEL